MAEPRAPRLAVLIDADNTSSKIAAGLFEEISRIGEASVRRIYGNFADTRLKGWVKVLSRHAIMPHQTFANTPGKNASDIALVIDAMDLLHSGRVDGFCLVSSDSDFTGLAMRVREHGLDVYGFGEQKTSESFRKACRRFIYFKDLSAAAAPKAPEPASARPAPARKTPGAARKLIRTAISQLDDEDGWVLLNSVGQKLRVLASDFKSKAYGYAQLSELVEKAGFDVRRIGKTRVYVRCKPPVSVTGPKAG